MYHLYTSITRHHGLILWMSSHTGKGTQCFLNQLDSPTVIYHSTGDSDYPPTKQNGGIVLFAVAFVAENAGMPPLP